MPAWSTYAVNALIAALLGAGTNELAIITILRYILPKKKSEIARRIRDLIATDLLSPAKMKQKLDDPAVISVVENNTDDMLRIFLERDLPSPDVLLANHQAEVDTMLCRGKEALLGEYRRRVSQPEFASQVIRPFLEERWRILRDRTPASLLAKPDSMREFVEAWLRSLEDSPALKQGLARALDAFLADRIAKARSAADLLTPGLVRAAEDFVAAEAPFIIRQMTDILRTPGVRDTIVAAIMNSIRQQLGGQGMLGDLKGLFVNMIGIKEDVQGICRRLPDVLDANFAQPANRHNFIFTLRAAVARALTNDLGDEFRSPALRERLVNAVMNSVWRRDMFERAASGVGVFMERASTRPLKETLAGFGMEELPSGLIDEAAARAQRILASASTLDLLEKQFDELLAAWRRRPLGRLERFLPEASRRRLAAVVAREGRTLIQARLGDFAEQTGVWDIITASIENYDDRELAGMIQQLARSELRWVTILGGIIGLVVGLLQTVFQGLGWF